MDEPVDLTPGTVDPAARRTALALTAVLGASAAAPRRTGLDAALADVEHRAVRRHRRRTAAGALSATAVVALALAAPSLLPSAVVERPATGVPAQRAPAPDEREPSVAPSSSTSRDPLLSDARMAALYPGLSSSSRSGSVEAGSSGRSSPAVGGYCGDTELGVDGPRQTWETAWKPPGTPGADDVSIQEKVLRWEGADADEAVIRYAQATRDSTVVCAGPVGGTYEPLITTEPGGALPSQGVLAPGGATTGDGDRSTWRVRAISPVGDGLTVVELSADVAAPDGPEAARSVRPLLEAALESAASRDDVAPGELTPGPAGALADRAPDVPRSGPTQPPPSPAWRAPLSYGSTLTLAQVRSVVPAAAPSTFLVTARPAIFVPGCDGLPGLPADVPPPADERSAAWVARDADGEPVVEVSERVLRWDVSDPARAYVAGMSDAATACTTDPADPVDRTNSATTAWREVGFRSADGARIDALVRPAGADRPGTWVLRATSAPTVGTTAVDVQVTARAASPDALVAVMAPLLRAAAERAAADQIRAFNGGATLEPDVP